MEEIPREILCEIAALVPYGSLVNYSEINNKYHRLCNNEQIWKIKLEQDFPGISPDKNYKEAYKKEVDKLLSKLYTKNYTYPNISGELDLFRLNYPLIYTYQDLLCPDGTSSRSPFSSICSEIWVGEFGLYGNVDELCDKYEDIKGKSLLVKLKSYKDSVNDIVRAGKAEIIDNNDIPSFLNKYKELGYVSLNNDDLYKEEEYKVKLIQLGVIKVIDI